MIAMTITLATVYTPIALQGGLTGSLFLEFAALREASLIAAEHRPDEPSEAVKRTAPDGERAQPIAGIA